MSSLSPQLAPARALLRGRGPAILVLPVLLASGCNDPAATPPQTADATAQNEYEGEATTGEGDSGGTPSEDASTGDEQTNSETTSTGDAGETGENDCDPDIHYTGPARLRRLTRAQYNNTIRDLFPGVALPQYNLPDAPAVDGFVNHAEQQNASTLLIEALHTNALDISERLMAKPGVWLACVDEAHNDATEQACGHGLVERLGPRVLRQRPENLPLAQYRDLFDELRAAGDFRSALQLTLQALLQSPYFVYRHEFEGERTGMPKTTVPLSSMSVANRLAYFLWNSGPDEILFTAALGDELATRDAVRAQAERMLQDPRARTAAIEFHRQWFNLAALAEAQPDREAHPEFNEALRASMAEEFARLVEHLIFTGPGDLTALFTAQTSHLNRILAEHYGLSWPQGEDPEKWLAFEHSPGQRAGLLTSAAFLSAHAQAIHPSPVRRGIFVIERLLCLELEPPPGDVDTSLPPEGDGSLSNRERYNQHSQDPTCAGCHSFIDPLGFSFEHYDATGRYRTHDAGKPVNATVQTVLPQLSAQFEDAVQLSSALAAHPSVHACLARHWLSYALGRRVSDDPNDSHFDRDSSCMLAEVLKGFEHSQGQLRELWLDIAVTDAFRMRRTTP